jgi:division protein CdvB (Snf7/Vps24/ESCRT-III family)
MASTHALTDSMKKITKSMVALNKQTKLPELQKIMQEFAKSQEQMEMKSEMIGDVLDETLDDEEDEKESEMIVSQVLDELVSGTTTASDSASDRCSRLQLLPAITDHRCCCVLSCRVSR